MIKKTCIVLIVLILLFWSFRSSNEDSNDYYCGLIKEKTGFPFTIETVLIGYSYVAIMDQELSLKAFVANRFSEEISLLVNMGWHTSPLPKKQLIQEGILRDERILDNELLEYSENGKYMWLYIDRYYERYGEKTKKPGTNETWNFYSPNYAFFVYFPEQSTLYYYESN